METTKVNAETGSLEDYKPQSANANLHTERGLGALEKSIQEDGWIGAITVAADGESFDGSARIDTGISSGFKDAIVVRSDGTRPIVHIREDIPSAQDPRAKRLGIAANRVAQLDLQWNGEVLSQIQQEHPDMLSNLFFPQELETLFESIENAQQANRKEGQGGDEFDATPALDKPTRTQYGDIWKMGEDHTLMVGDSGNHEDVSLLMQYANPYPLSLIVTSPPYGVGKEYEQGGIEEWKELIMSVFSECAKWSTLWFVNLANRRTGNDGYEAHTFGMMVDIFKGIGAEMLALRIWQKPPAWATPGPYWRHTYKAVDDYEFLGLFCTEKPRYVNRLTDQENTDWGYRGIWQFASVQSNSTHSAQFPLELPLRAIKMLTDPHDTVYDPLSGSGTTMTAAHRTQRRSIMMEKLPNYADLCLGRAEAEGISPITLVRRIDSTDVEPAR